MSTDQTQPAKAVDQKAPSIDYNISEKGVITRTDKDSTIEVATIREDGALVLNPDWTKFRPAVVRFINEQTDRKITAVYVEGDEPSPAKAKREIPPMPKKNPRLGDKTPEVVEWFKRYKPEEYRARYGIRGNGTVTKYRKVLNEKGEAVSEAYQVDAVIAERKTHLTEKPEANDATITGDSEYDESLDQPSS